MRDPYVWIDHHFRADDVRRPTVPPDPPPVSAGKPLSRMTRDVCTVEGMTNDAFRSQLTTDDNATTIDMVTNDDVIAFSATTVQLDEDEDGNEVEVTSEILFNLSVADAETLIAQLATRVAMSRLVAQMKTK